VASEPWRFPRRVTVPANTVRTVRFNSHPSRDQNRNVGRMRHSAFVLLLLIYRAWVCGFGEEEVQGRFVSKFRYLAVRRLMLRRTNA
jgi:hypothetical protein